MTTLLFREDAFLRDCKATVTAINERGGILLDRTVFYATAGGQPGDRGRLSWPGGSCAIATTVYDEEKRPVHVPADGETPPPVGTAISAELDWATRYRNMRAHTLMHLLCASVPFPVTGGAITEDGGRIDFDIPEGQIPERDALSARLNALVAGNHMVGFRWISDEEMDANPQLIRTLSVKPPRGTGRVRLVLIGENGGVDMQPCGGTHVAATGEIGPVQVVKIENKGKINRRIRVGFAGK
jgi:misacylated tRNA(Ala) deacylase